MTHVTTMKQSLQEKNIQGFKVINFAVCKLLPTCCKFIAFICNDTQVYLWKYPAFNIFNAWLKDDKWSSLV